MIKYIVSTDIEIKEIAFDAELITLNTRDVLAKLNANVNVSLFDNYEDACRFVFRSSRNNSPATGPFLFSTTTPFDYPIFEVHQPEANASRDSESPALLLKQEESKFTPLMLKKSDIKEVSSAIGGYAFVLEKPTHCCVIS